MTLFKSIRNCLRRWRYQEGRTLSRFIARDIRREVLIISAAKVEEGVITARVRTTNLLYRSAGLIPETEFEPAREHRIDELWHWTGKPWGGLLDGTSLPARQLAESPGSEIIPVPGENNNQSKVV